VTDFTVRADVHTLVVVNPGHFHAALSLCERNPKLSDDVYVYAEAGADLDRFLAIVRSFNERGVDPTRWNLIVYRGADYMARLRADRTGDVAIVAGKNNTKLADIHRLHEAGFYVLGDKPWLTEPRQIGMLREVLSSPPLCRDIMTERYEIANRLLRALAASPEVFGSFRTDAGTPAIDIKSVHHLYKRVNGAPLVRPPWYFDVAVQGEGIVDVTTHLVDLVQWLISDNQTLDFERDISALAARHWWTAVPREVFAQVTGLADFPALLRPYLVDGVLHYRCNALIEYRLRGIPVSIEALWDLTEPVGGGDWHHIALLGNEADLIVEQGAQTGYLTELWLAPRRGGRDYDQALQATIASLQVEFPGLRAEPAGSRIHIVAPRALRTTHEQHFAQVLQAFLEDIDDDPRATQAAASGLITKYTLLARAAELSRRRAEGATKRL
jgi:predicted dehydrogenase